MVTHSELPALELALRPTPLHRLPRLSAEVGVELFVKRDDLTGAALSGNKVRKLEYLLHEALTQGADTVMTCGGIQSNHCRATALAAAQLGLRCQLVLRGSEPARLEGNLLLDRVVGALVRWVTPDEYRDREWIFAEEQGRLEALGHHVAVIPEGGSNALGAMGYVTAAFEIAEQARSLGVSFDTIVCAVGSGGTLAGLVAGVRAAGLDARVLGVNVCDDAPTFERIVGGLLAELRDRYGLPDATDGVELLDGYVGRGYALSSPEELALLRHVARTDGLLLDPVYTGKAFYALHETLRRDRGALGDRVLFVHTGGLFGLFPKAGDMASVLSPD
jgi:D-cysteine desulfhydrase